MRNYGSLRRAGPDSPRLRTERINSGIYQYSYDGRMVEVCRLAGDPGDGCAPCWLAIQDGEYVDDHNTKRAAVEHAKRILGVSA